MRYRLIGVVLLAVALGLTSDAFATASNLLNVLRQASLIFLSASGLTLVIVGAGLDLSVGANLGLSACFAAAAVKSTGCAITRVCRRACLWHHRRNAEWADGHQAPAASLHRDVRNAVDALWRELLVHEG